MLMAKDDDDEGKERKKRKRKKYLNGSANSDGGSFSKDEITQLSTLQMVDAEVNSSNPFITRSYVSSDACQSL